MKKLYLTKRMNLYFYFDVAKVLRKTAHSKYSFRFFLNYSRHALIFATKPANALNLCRMHPQKSPPKFVYAEKRMYLCSKLDNIWIARMKKH